VGRRNLIGVAALTASLAVASTAGAALSWRAVGDGPATGPVVNAPRGFIAFGRPAALALFGSRLTGAARAKLGRIDFARDALVAVFGEFGCNDANIVTTTVTRHEGTVTVHLARKLPAAGTVTCQAIFATYRFLVVPRSDLPQPFPKRVVVDLA
jgi:hypothetical protein